MYFSNDSPLHVSYEHHPELRPLMNNVNVYCTHTRLCIQVN
jgi:hypothetical protein